MLYIYCNLLTYGVVNLKCLLRLPTHLQLPLLCFVREGDIVLEPVVAAIFSSDSVLDVSPSRSFGGGEESLISLGSLFPFSPESEKLHASVTKRLKASGLSAYTWCPAPVITCRYVSQTSLCIPLTSSTT